MSISTRPKPFVFVLMPFKDEFDDIYILGIKAACEAAGAYCERVDEQFYQGRILDRIYNQIAKADIIVSDMSGRNPNVFYETGYAHALGKQVILLTQDMGDIPFDLKDYPHVIYGRSILILKAELEKRVRWCVDNPSGSLASVDFGLVPYINHIPYQRGAVLDFMWQYVHGNRAARTCGFSISFHNATERPRTGYCRAKLEIPPWITLWEQQENYTLHAANEVELPNKNRIADLSDIDLKVLPDEWIHLLPEHELVYFANSIPGEPCETHNILHLHIYTELGRKEFPIEFKPPNFLEDEDSEPSS